MRDGWREVTLGGLCTITKGTSPTQKTLPGPYPLIVTGPEPLSSESFQFDGEAVCVPLVSSTGHGHASLKRVHYASGKFAVANIIAACVPQEEACLDARFLFHYLQHVKDAEIVTRMKGTANVSLSITNLAAVPVTLPPLDEQRRIVDLIAAVDDAVDAAESEVDGTLGLLRAALDVHLDKAESMRSVSDIALQPRGLVGGPFGSSLVSADYRDTGVPIIRGTNMPDLLGTYVGGDFAFVDSSKADALSGNLALPGDVVFTQRGTIGQVGMVPDAEHPRYVVSQSQMRLRVDPALSTPEYVRFVFTAPAMVSALRAQDRATANPHINLGILAKTEIPVPPLSVQQELISEWGSLQSAADAARATAESLRTLRSNLLTVLLSGEHEIPASYDALLGEVA